MKFLIHDENGFPWRLALLVILILVIITLALPCVMF